MNNTTTLPTRYSWLVRRELWEHKLVTWAPAILALVIVVSVLAGYATHGSVELQFDGDEMQKINEAATHGKFELVAAAGLTLVSVVFLMLANGLQFFYAADALYAERAQRTILFWKSLPVSDLQTVLSKLLVASVVAPLVAWAAAVVTEIIVAAVVSLQFGHIPGALSALWSPSVWWYSLYMTFYLLVTTSIWYVPVIAWMLLVSAWMPLARGMRLGRSPIVVGVLIPMALMLAEGIIFRSHKLYGIVMDRVLFRGYAAAALRDAQGITIDGERMNELQGTVGMLAGRVVHPLSFLATPSVWAGLVATALMIAGAVYCRRRSENRG